MEKAFFDLFAIRKEILNLHCCYTRNVDWSLSISDRRKGVSEDPLIFHTQHCNRNLVFARAYVFLAEWYSEEFGGY